MTSLRPDRFGEVTATTVAADGEAAGLVVVIFVVVIVVGEADDPTVGFGFGVVLIFVVDFTAFFVVDVAAAAGTPGIAPANANANSAKPSEVVCSARFREDAFNPTPSRIRCCSSIQII